MIWRLNYLNLIEGTQLFQVRGEAVVGRGKVVDQKPRTAIDQESRRTDRRDGTNTSAQILDVGAEAFRMLVESDQNLTDSCIRSRYQRVTVLKPFGKWRQLFFADMWYISAAPRAWIVNTFNFPKNHSPSVVVGFERHKIHSWRSPQALPVFECRHRHLKINHIWIVSYDQIDKALFWTSMAMV